MVPGLQIGGKNINPNGVNHRIMAITIRLVFVAIVLGLGWAMRGHFGHEWGASWAGAMGALAVLLVSGRKDWIQRAPVLTALGAIGWAVGGMMSYGIVIGYCRSLSFPNALYGYAIAFSVTAALSSEKWLYGPAWMSIAGAAITPAFYGRPELYLLVAAVILFAAVVPGIRMMRKEPASAND